MTNHNQASRTQGITKVLEATRQRGNLSRARHHKKTRVHPKLSTPCLAPRQKDLQTRTHKSWSARQAPGRFAEAVAHHAWALPDLTEDTVPSRKHPRNWLYASKVKRKHTIVCAACSVWHRWHLSSSSTAIMQALRTARSTSTQEAELDFCHEGPPVLEPKNFYTFAVPYPIPSSTRADAMAYLGKNV